MGRARAEEDLVAVKPAARSRGAREPVHAAVHPVRDEGLVAREVGLQRQVGARDRDRVEPEAAGLRDHALFHARLREAIMRRHSIA